VGGEGVTRGLFSQRNARLYIVGQAVSLLGDSCLWLGVGIWVKTLTHSNAKAGLVFFFFTAAALLSPLSGLAVDRMRRRPLMIATNIGTAGAVLLLLAVKSSADVWLIFGVMFLYGLSYTVLGPAQSALLTVIVPEPLLADANASLRTVQESLRLVGPLGGAGLFVLVGAHAIVILDAASFSVPVVCLLLLRVVEPPPTPAAHRWRQEVSVGIKYIWHTDELRQIVVAAAIGTTVFGFAETVVYAIVGEGLHRPTAFVGVLVAAQGVGAVAAGLSAPRVLRRVGERRLVGLGMASSACGVLLEIPPSLVSVIPGAVLFGFAVPWVVVGFITLAQRLTPHDLQGRVYSAADVVVTTPQSASIALGAGLIGLTGFRPLLATMSVVTAVGCLYLFTRRDDGESSAVGVP